MSIIKTSFIEEYVRSDMTQKDWDMLAFMRKTLFCLVCKTVLDGFTSFCLLMSN